MAERTGTVVVGAGISGIQAASRLSQEDHGNFIVLEKQSALGGVWSSHANKSSRVQIPEPGYRVQSDRPMSEFTEQGELLDELELLCSQSGIKERTRFGCEVCRVSDSGGGVEVQYRDASGAPQAPILADHVLLCTGGLQEPRLLRFPGEGAFAGDHIAGVGAQIDKTRLAGRRVAVLGMGAFAIENARTALLKGASHVTIVARSLNLILPKLMVLMVSLSMEKTNYTYREPSGAKKRGSKRNKESEAFMRFVSSPYQKTGVAHLMPGKMQSGKNNFNPIEGNGLIRLPTVSDIFFIALRLGLLDVVVGEVESFDADGVHVHGPELSAPCHVPCDVVVQCFGFESPDPHLAALVGRERIRSPLYITERVLLMKGERNPSLESARGVPATDINLAGSVFVMSDLFMEIFLHFRSHPEELPALLEELPHPEIYEDGYAHCSLGLATILSRTPALQGRVDALRAKYASQVKSKYAGGMMTVLRKNKAEWKEACAALTGGNEKAVPYMWDDMLGVMMASQMGKKDGLGGAIAAKL